VCDFCPRLVLRVLPRVPALGYLRRMIFAPVVLVLMVMAELMVFVAAAALLPVFAAGTRALVALLLGSCCWCLDRLRRD
jgi:hypothetical protein